MCGPAAPLIAAGISAAGTLVGGYMANKQGRYQSALANQNAAMAEGDARDSVLRGQDEARGFFRQASQVKGQQIAAAAANGIDLGYGSALRMQEDTAALIDDDARDLYSNIHERTRGFLMESVNQRAEAEAAKYRGKQALIGSAFQAGATLAGGFSQMKGLQGKLPGSTRKVVSDFSSYLSKGGRILP